MREHNWLDSNLVAQRLEHITPVFCATKWFGSHNGERMRTEPRRSKMEALKRLNHVICPLASDLLAPLYKSAKIGGD
jgi:hypothetical protein